jgi:endonuclease/exonuclease/phosphatase family metal-dependent hydrolase
MFLLPPSARSLWRWPPLWAVAAALATWFAVTAPRGPADLTLPLLVRGAASPPTASQRTIKLACFNIHGGQGTDGRLDLTRIADQLTDIDVAGLQEVRIEPHGPFPDQAAELGDLLRRQSLLVPTERYWGRHHHGNALVSRWPIESAVPIPLPRQGAKGYRTAFLARVAVHDRRVSVLVAHLDGQADRTAQLERVIGLFESLAEPAVLMGDFNTSRDDALLTRLRNTPNVVDVAGDSAPPECCDWIFLKGLRRECVENRQTIASDHAVLVAEVSLP